MTIGTVWELRDEEYLRVNYPSSSTKDIAESLGRSLLSVKTKASKLGLKKTAGAISESLSSRYDEKLNELNALSLTEVPLEVAFKHREWLRHHYYDLELSTQDIADLTFCTRKNVEYWMRKYGVPRRDNITSRTERFREKISETGKGRIPFSKGLTKHDHPSIMLISDKCRGELSYNWKGGISFSNGYKKIRVTDHPNRDRDGYVLEHRLVMEFILARLLTPKEVVHHRDHNRHNNLSANLFLFPDHRAHGSFHAHKKHVDSNITEERFMSEVYANAA